MSARDSIIESIKELPLSDKREVKEIVDQLIEAESESAGPRIMPRDAFEHAKAHVFAHYGPLLEELAK